MARRPSSSPPGDAPDAPRGRVLDAAEAVLRRHGPAKTTVSDVARALGLTHASVYRHFASKADLIDALVGRWLGAVIAPLGPIAAGEGSASQRLRAWLVALHHQKIRKVTADPEHFALYHGLAVASREVARRHVDELLGMIESIVASGVAAGEFRVSDPRRASRAVQDATLRFHHPALILASVDPPTEAELHPVIDLLLAGLRVGVV